MACVCMRAREWIYTRMYVSRVRQAGRQRAHSWSAPGENPRMLCVLFKALYDTKWDGLNGIYIARHSLDSLNASREFCSSRRQQKRPFRQHSWIVNEHANPTQASIIDHRSRIHALRQITRSMWHTERFTYPSGTLIFIIHRSALSVDYVGWYLYMDDENRTRAGAS